MVSRRLSVCDYLFLYAYMPRDGPRRKKDVSDVCCEGFCRSALCLRLGWRVLGPSRAGAGACEFAFVLRSARGLLPLAHAGVRAMMLSVK